MNDLSHGSAGNFRLLRLAYEDAFRDFACRVRQFQTLGASETPDASAVLNAEEQLAKAATTYRQRRNLLAQYLMSDGASFRP